MKEISLNGVCNMGYMDDINCKCVTPWGTVDCSDAYVKIGWPDQYKEEPKMKPTVYKINEMFESIQGEGYHTGEPVIFVRLAGCSMGCEWCDTKYCQEVHYKLTAEQIADHIEKNFVKKPIVISGGEPFEQDLKELVKMLQSKGFHIWIETNGAEEIPGGLGAWITVSPKKYFLNASLAKADEIKLVISDEKDIQRAKRLRSHYQKTNFYLQPESGKKEATKLCVQTCLEDPRFKLSVQVHKLIDIK